MELIKVNSKPVWVEDISPVQETSNIHFMAANTDVIKLEEMSKKHTIPVFAKDNESTISHQEFIETVSYVSEKIFGGETILSIFDLLAILCIAFLIFSSDLAKGFLSE